mmetsp:Transcript_54339/g.132803  ORF Transcript_54339/g.132803 Transcript_54339/m.132803 type:complete len:248 (-) Transcript_54339:94-837(-)
MLEEDEPVLSSLLLAVAPGYWLGSPPPPEVALLEARYVPHTHGLVERSTHNHVLLGVELHAHHVVVVASQHGDARARLPVPDPDGLVVGRADDPRVLVVELHGAHVVEMTQHREKTALKLVVPDLDLVVVASADDQRLVAVEVHAAHRPVVLVKAIEEGAHAEVPELDDAIVERDHDPGPLRVEGEALDAVGFGLELGEEGVGLHAARRARGGVCAPLPSRSSSARPSAALQAPHAASLSCSLSPSC